MANLNTDSDGPLALVLAGGGARAAEEGRLLFTYIFAPG